MSEHSIKREYLINGTTFKIGELVNCNLDGEWKTGKFFGKDKDGKFQVVDDTLQGDAQLMLVT